MKVVQSWLRQFVPFRFEPEELARKLGMLGLETADIEQPGPRYEGFVVGHVLDKAKHPHADRLSVCTVDVGKQRLSVVCGAPNVAPGQKVVVGKTATLELAPPQVETLALAQQLGSLSLALRSITDIGKATPTAETDNPPAHDAVNVFRFGATTMTTPR